MDSQPGRGSVFRVRLFLPELHSDALPAPQAAARIGYAGERRRILVVDNEEADRGLLVSVLEPLGFDLRTAASGEQCLAMLPYDAQTCPDFWATSDPAVCGTVFMGTVAAIVPARQKPIVAWGVSKTWTPPTSARLHSPLRRLAHARCVATNEEEQAVSTARFGPPRPSR